jgi:RHS repeat-associated protein
MSIYLNGYEAASYEYDAWGNCTITKDIDGIGTINPIRWKSQYYDNESGLYYINGKYYSPLIKQYLCMSSPESVISSSEIIYGLYMYHLTVENPVNLEFNSYSIATYIKLAWDPPELSKIGVFWRSNLGKFFAGLLFGAALLLN